VCDQHIRRERTGEWLKNRDSGRQGPRAGEADIGRGKGTFDHCGVTDRSIDGDWNAHGAGHHPSERSRIPVLGCDHQPNGRKLRTVGLDREYVTAQ